VAGAPRKKDRLPPGADERARAIFQKSASYMVLLDDKSNVQEHEMPKTFRHSGSRRRRFM